MRSSDLAESTTLMTSCSLPSDGAEGHFDAAGSGHLNRGAVEVAGNCIGNAPYLPLHSTRPA